MPRKKCVDKEIQIYINVDWKLMNKDITCPDGCLVCRISGPQKHHLQNNPTLFNKYRSFISWKIWTKITRLTFISESFWWKVMDFLFVLLKVNSETSTPLLTSVLAHDTNVFITPVIIPFAIAQISFHAIAWAVSIIWLT